jgi:hypothetical protein
MGAALASPQYLARVGDVARDRDAVLSIWRGNLGDDARMPRKYAWFYEQADAGPPLLELLTADGREVGTCSAGRRRMLRDGQPLRAGVMVDLAVMPEHRTLGPAMMLQQSLAQAARGQLDLLYAFPNPKAAPVFKRIGYRPLGDLVRYVRVLRHGPYLARRMPRVLAYAAGIAVDAWTRARDALRHAGTAPLRATWSDRVDPRVQQLWEDSTKPDGIVGARDAAHLRWRFDASPEGGFRHLLVRDASSDALVAWFAVRANGATLHVHDYWSLHGPAIGTRCLDALLRAARKAGHAAVSLELASLSPHLAPWLAMGFSERSRRAVFGYWDAAALGEHLGQLHLTAADEDE